MAESTPKRCQFERIGERLSGRVEGLLKRVWELFKQFILTLKGVNRESGEKYFKVFIVDEVPEL